MKADILTIVLVVTLVAVAQAQVVTRAVAVLSPTKGNSVSGTVTFTKVQTGVKIVADVSGLTPGAHGFHIHEFGDCTAPDASSAGGHFNPSHTYHGAPDMPFRHVGDFGNLVADASGKAHYERVDTIVFLNGPNSVIGHAVIVHEKADDFKTQPTGNAGGRAACGVIGVASP
jgi:Cu-Zn family superoxide dismutase